MKKILLIIYILLFSSYAFAAGNSGNDGVGSIQPKTSISKPVEKITHYKSAEKNILKAKKYEKKNKSKKALDLYEDAFKKLLKANKQEPFNPDILNYLGFVNRKLGNFNDAEIYYILGLEINPNHLGINEYLGELYVVTNRMSLAKERLEVLKNCNCEEFQELKEIIDGTRKSKN